MSSIVHDNDTVIIITVAQAQHGLEDNDVVVLDDFRDNLECCNNQQFAVKRVAFQSPSAAQVNTTDVAFQEALKQPTTSVLTNFQRQYDYYQEQFFESSSDDNKKKFPVRTITMFNRLALVLKNDDTNSSITPDVFRSYEAGGLLHQVRPVVTKQYKSLQETLESGTAVPQMLRGEDWEHGKGIDVHLSLAAVLEFYDQNNQRWPRIHNQEDAKKVVDLAKAISVSNKSKENACWAQKVEFGFPSGEEREVDEMRIERFAKLFQTELRRKKS